MAGEKLRTLCIYGRLFSIDNYNRIRDLEGDKNFPLTATVKQLEVLSLIAKGKSYKEIAGEMGTTTRYVGNMMEKLRLVNGEKTTTELLGMTVKMKLLHPHVFEQSNTNQVK